MIEYRTGDLLQVDAEALVNAVNCVGTMGRGVALQFRNAYPENFKAYEAACAHDEVHPGRMFVLETGQRTNMKYIIISQPSDIGAAGVGWQISTRALGL